MTVSLKERIQVYYRGERITNVVLICFGAATASFGLLFHLYDKSDMSLGLFSGLGLIGSIQMFVGAWRLWKTFRFYRLSIESTESDNSYLLTTELSRVQDSDKRYQKMRTILTVVFLIFFFSIVLCACLDSNKFLMGSGAAVTLNAAVLLALDLFSQFRTREYIYQLKKLE